MPGAQAMAERENRGVRADVKEACKMLEGKSIYEFLEVLMPCQYCIQYIIVPMIRSPHQLVYTVLAMIIPADGFWKGF